MFRVSVLVVMGRRMPRWKVDALDRAYRLLDEHGSPTTARAIEMMLLAEKKSPRTPSSTQLTAWLQRDDRFKRVGISSPILWDVVK